jgi:hypothetical protein
MTTLKTSKILLGSCAALILGSLAAHATVIDLTTSSSGTLDGGLFQLANTQPAGTGVFEPFLTIQNKVTEQGYNSSTGNFDTKREPVWNHEIKLSDLNATTINNVQYYSFEVDINEPNGTPKNLISLNRFTVSTSPTVQTTTSTDASGVFNGSLGTLRYDSGAGNAVYINDVNHGSGQSDLSIYIPVSAFGDALPTDNVYVYEYWGVNFNTEGGFEETRLGAGVSVTAVPEVSALLPLIGLFGAIGGSRWRRARTVTA